MDRAWHRLSEGLVIDRFSFGKKDDCCAHQAVLTAAVTKLRGAMLVIKLLGAMLCIAILYKSSVPGTKAPDSVTSVTRLGDGPIGLHSLLHSPDS